MSQRLQIVVMVALDIPVCVLGESFVDSCARLDCCMPSIEREVGEEENERVSTRLQACANRSLNSGRYDLLSTDGKDVAGSLSTTSFLDPNRTMNPSWPSMIVQSINQTDCIGFCYPKVKN